MGVNGPTIPVAMLNQRMNVCGRYTVSGRYRVYLPAVWVHPVIEAVP